MWLIDRNTDGSDAKPDSAAEAIAAGSCALVRRGGNTP